MSNELRVHIFVSYAQEDSQVADEVVAVLQGLRYQPWIDRQQIRPGDRLVEKVNEGLSRAAYVVVLLSRAALSSPWVSREWMSSLMAKETVVVPLLIDDCPIPPLLRDILYIDLRTNRPDGLARLRSLFENDTTPIVSNPEVLRSPESAGMLTVSRQALRRVALRCMDEGAYKGLLFDLNIEPGQIPGDSLHERITNLLFWIAKAGELEYAAKWLPLEPSCQRCVANEIQKLK